MSTVNPMSVLQAVPLSQSPHRKEGGGSGSWFEAVANAWGAALDKQASIIEQKSAALEGDDTPSAITELTAQSMRMGFLSNSSHTSLGAIGQALETMARKQ